MANDVDESAIRNRAVSSVHFPKTLLSEFSLYIQDTRFILKPNRPGLITFQIESFLYLLFGLIVDERHL
jgi:hypothetical protein